jgi:hypothetical protein
LTGASSADIPVRKYIHNIFDYVFQQIQRYSMAIVVWSSFMGSFVTMSMVAIEVSEKTSICMKIFFFQISSAFLPSVRPHVIEPRMQRASLQTMTSVCSIDIESDADKSWLLHKK